MKTVLFILLNVCLQAVGQDILVSPQNTTVFLNQPAVVSCETSGADFMIWRINGTSIPNLPPEIRSDLESENEGDNERDVFTLTITGRVTYNTTTVQCVIGRIGGDIIESENAIIRIQGLLASVRNIETHCNTSSVTISWSAPFSLDVTGVDPDIWYSVLIYNVTDEENPTAVPCTDCHNLTQTHYIFSPDYPSPCHKYTFTVIPFNGAGAGESSQNVTGSDTLVGYETTLYTTSEGIEQVEICAVLMSPGPATAPGYFVLSWTTESGTAIEEIDYVGQSANLEFALGDSRICHTIDIIQDDVCEHPDPEDFFASLAYVSGIQNINIVQDSTRVLIDDSGEPECIHLQSGYGQYGCIVNVPISSGVIYVPPGTVCIECVFDSVLAADAEFQIDNQNIDESVGIEDNGVLMVFDTENVFSSSSTRTIKCTSDDNIAQALMILATFRPPVITGETTLNEGDTLDLVCDGSTSSPLPSVEWLSPQGNMISNSRDLNIMNIRRTAMGVYTCIITQFVATLNSSVNVTVLFFRPPVITGETTLSEGDTLDLDCDGSTSSPLPSVQWFSPQGDLISNSGDLEIMNILRSAMGIYTCVATQLTSRATLNSTVNVIIQCCLAVFVNDTVTDDLLITVPIYDNPNVRPRDLFSSLCYEVRGESNHFFNLISDGCISVNAYYERAQTINVVTQIGVTAVGHSGICSNITVNLRGNCEALVNGRPLGSSRVDGIQVKQYANSSRVRISVPNCGDTTLVMWVFCKSGQIQDPTTLAYYPINYIQYVVMRGLNLNEKSHGLIGQFWNVPVTVSPYNGDYDGVPRTDDYVITVHHPDSPPRSFVGLRYPLTWGHEDRVCYYVGNPQAGPLREVPDPNDSVIEGVYDDYKVDSLFATDYIYSHFTVCG